MNNRLKYILSLFLILGSLFLVSCDPTAKWEIKNVTIDINPYTVSAGYIECSFTPNKEAYYLVACVPAREGYDPMEHQKQFMTLALDSAHLEYLEWRHYLLEQGEFTIAPFSSHSLQYGAIDHFFTNLTPQTKYWVYAFVVNPDKMEPVGKLYLQTFTTTIYSIVDVKFEYRVRGLWDYIYPINASDGKINNHFPYMAATVDSASLHTMAPEDYFDAIFDLYAETNVKEFIRYGVQVVLNDGYNSDEAFEVDHTYYTAIVGFDGRMGNNVIYKFKWTGEDFEAYFKNEDSIVLNGQNN